ncbi:hypothetical protein XENOCAPTIV_009049 [Xenoophorus captivus]|uniref:Uncharacterized protein n=1 Tax=Xenoophorus captivus TaxID=1517983 RepID=A0ABV0RPR3_9TELE
MFRLALDLNGLNGSGSSGQSRPTEKPNKEGWEYKQGQRKSPVKKPQPNKPPRAIIVNFSKFEIKENILGMALKNDVKVGGERVTFDQDYATEVAAKRRKYAVLKRIFKENGMQFKSPMDTLRVHWPEGNQVYHRTQRGDAAEKMAGTGPGRQGADTDPEAGGSVQVVKSGEHSDTPPGVREEYQNAGHL